MSALGGDPSRRAYQSLMAVAFDPRELPLPIRAAVERALGERDGHVEAIGAIESHLAAGGERTPDLLVALAAVTYDDAAAVLMHRLGEAAGRALELLDEAARVRGTADGLQPLRDAFEATQERERIRATRLRGLMLAPDRARPTDLAELAHRLRMAGDDHISGALMAEATRLDEDADERVVVDEACVG